MTKNSPTGTQNRRSRRDSRCNDEAARGRERSGLGGRTRSPN